MLQTIIQFSALSLILYGVALMVLIFCAALYFNRGRQNENHNQRIIMFGFASLILCLAIGQFLNLLLLFELNGEYINNIFYSEGKIVVHSPATKSFYIAQILVYLTGTALFILAFEIILNRTKLMLTFLNVILLILSLIFWILKYSEAQLDYFDGFIFSNFYEIPIVYNIVLVILILYYFTQWSELELKKLASIIQFGLLLLVFGLILSGGQIKYYNTFPVEFSPLFLILGGIFLLFPLVSNFEQASNPLKVWKILGAVSIILGAFMTLFVLLINIFNPHFNFSVYVSTSFLAIFFLLVIIFVNYRNIKIIKTLILEGKGQDKETINILEMFKRPLKISEEQISQSKEKRLCIICKNKISKFNYVCPDCEALYCKKCYDASVKLENICWVCQRALDDSKPIQIYDSPLESERDLHGKINLPPKEISSGPFISLYDPAFINKLDQVDWDDQERTEFLKEMALYPSKERMDFLEDLVRDSAEINQKLQKKNLRGIQ